MTAVTNWRHNKLVLLLEKLQENKFLETRLLENLPLLLLVVLRNPIDIDQELLL